MLRSLYVRTAVALVSACMALVFLVGQGACQDSTGVLAKAKKNYDEFFKKVKDVKIVSVMTMGGAAAKMTNTITTYRKGDKTRVETKMEMPEGVSVKVDVGNSMETVLLDDGTATWVASGVMPKRKLTSQEAVQTEKEDDWWRRFPDNAKIVREEKYGGRDCYIVEITLAKGQKPVKAWLDKDKLIIMGGEGLVKAQMMRWVHSDFRNVEGREFPYKTEFFMGDKLASTMIVESVEVNTGLSDDLFDPAKLGAGNRPGLDELRKKWGEAKEGGD